MRPVLSTIKAEKIMATNKINWLFFVLYFGLSLVYSVQAKTAIAIFNNAGVSGTVKYVQEAVTDPVSIKVNLEGLEKRASGYHVHELPVNFGGSGFQLNSFNDTGCGDDITADHFNPLLVQGGANNKESGPYLCSQEQPSLCESGDISGKFGNLLNLDFLKSNYTDSDSGLTLFGKDSIIGRSMVIHRVDGSRLLCSTIFEENKKFSKIISTFDRETTGVEGTITLVPLEESEETLLFINIKLTDSNLITETDITLTMNNLPILDIRSNNKFSRCSLSSVGDIDFNFNSFLQETITLTKYKRTKLLRTIPQSIDVIDKSLVIASEEDIVDCSILGKLARVQFTQENNNGVVGDILFRQSSEISPVSVTIALEGLEGRANNFHVHTLPVFENEDCLSTTGHFNPFAVEGGDGVPGEYKCSSADPELCEAGDLSGRMGGLLGRSNAAYTFTDLGAGLTLFGENSIVGRSVVIHGQDGPSRLACANIAEVGRVVGQKASFSESSNAVEGVVEITQNAVDADAETTITFDVKRVDGETTERHMFHIHEAPVTTSTENNCGETGAHFSPSGVNGGAKQTGTYLCTEEDQQFCEIGDITGKHALTDLPNRFVLTDSTIPLSEVFTINGLSITFHDENKAPDRIDCANLEAFEVEFPDLNSVSTSGTGTEDNGDEANAGLVVVTVIFVMTTVILALYVLQLKSKQKTFERVSRAEGNADGSAMKATL